VEDAETPDEPPDIMGVCGELDARLSRGAEHPGVQVFVVAADQLPQCWGPGADDRNGGDWPECLPPLRQPPLGVVMVACGATPVTAGVVGRGLLTAVLTRPQRAAHDLWPAVDQIIHGAAMTGQEIRAHPLLRGGTIVPADVRHLWPARTPPR
jgi:hypothetical protein